METTSAIHIPDATVAKQLGLNGEEYQRICDVLGRKPNFNELSIYSVMWSEHCSYKNSIKYLKTLPRDGKRLLVGAGEENAGLVDIGDGLACAFKIESHNHPSAIEPYQGAATGVGGIHRDIFTMGARPIAALNSLRFGSLESKQMQHLIKGVVAGIGDYGNCLGVPTIGGEVYFDQSYRQNILVNAMSVGIVKVGETVSARADGPGNPVFIVGSATGRDGIHGATFASADLTEDSAEDLPAVQVGDPFQEKLLLEASLEAIKTGAIVGMQDMGAAGITCSTSEMSAKSGTGMRIDLDKVPTRQANMEAWEILLSESQERMLIVAKKGMEHLLLEVFEKWDLECEQIGVITDTGTLEYYQHGELVASVPAHSLVLGGGAPVYDREFQTPAYLQHVNAFNPSDIKVDTDILAVTEKLITSPNIASKRWVYEQYDHTVRTNNLNMTQSSDATVIRLKGTTKGIATTVDCNSRYVHADPYVGAMIAVSEAARNISCSGALPVAITNCLNFGNPYNPEVYWQFVNAIRGMGEACRKFDTPVTGGNVSFYNQSVYADSTEPVFPTPTIGMIGLLEDVQQMCTLGLKKQGDHIYLLGEITDDMGCSEYLHHVKKVNFSPAPYFFLYCFAALALALYGCSAVSNVSGTTITGNITGGDGLKVFLDKARPNNQTIVLSQADADQKGGFTMKFDESLEAGVYRLRIGAKKAFLIIDGSEKKVSITGDLNSFDTYSFTVDGSPATAEFRQAMADIASRKMDVAQLTSFMENAKEPLAAMQVAIIALQNNPEFMHLHKTALANVEKKYPNAEYTSDYKTMIATVEKAVAAQLSRERIQVGMPAPDIAMKSPDGKEYALSDLKGNVVLIDFWASWCGPCRKANPHVVEVYDKYKDKGFTVFSVSLDGIDSRTRATIQDPKALEKNIESSRQRWVDAIQKDNLKWKYHVSDLEKWDTRAAKEYGVTGIPKTFLVDREGNIAAINPRTNLEEAVLKTL